MMISTMVSVWTAARIVWTYSSCEQTIDMKEIDNEKTMPSVWQDEATL
jgi:hypothetical protein